MSEVNPESDLEARLRHDINEHMPEWDKELRGLLPTLPDEITIEIKKTPPKDYEAFAEGGWDYGVEGSTPTINSITIGVDVRARVSNEELLCNIKATYYHESYHLARGYSFESTGLTLLDVAIEEGLATKFEIDQSNAKPWHGQYQDRETMLAILEEVREADRGEAKDWQRWKFYYPGETPEQDRHWILYRLGTFIAAEALASSPELTVQDLAQLSREEILALAKL